MSALAPPTPANTNGGRRFRIAILSSGRFHVLDLARELHLLGHEVAFYSLVPTFRTRRFGLPDACNRWLGAFAGPAWLAARGLDRLTRHSEGSRPARALADRAVAEALDLAAARVIGPCDAFIGMSGMSRHTLERLKRRGTTTFLERGSMHIEAQKAILDAQHPGRPSEIADWVVRRERAEYELTDYISLPSRHAEVSFLERGFRPERLLRNPYGVSLVDFPPTPEPDGPPRILMVGRWSWQKGGDVLVEAFRRLQAERPTLELVHVGPLGDVPFPADLPRATHHEPVPQRALSGFYAQAHVAVLASRQEGLAVVQAQALASGLPLVCTTHTGGADLAELLGSPPWVSVVPPADPEALAAALAAQLDARRYAVGALRDPVGERGREDLSWRGYARRWVANLEARVPRR